MTQVLLVEDDNTLGTTLKERLERVGYEVNLAPSCEKARELMRSQKNSLAIIDVGLPDGDGFSLAREINESHKVPFIFLTAMNSAEYRLEGFELGAEEYIPKPFHLREFMLRVQKVLERHNCQPELKTGELTLLPESLTVQGPNGEVCLPRRDFELLFLLVRKSPQAVSREQIRENVWADSDAKSDRTIDNSILRLRNVIKETLDDEREESPIRTIRGLGYQWILDS